MAGDYKRSSSFQLEETASVTSLAAYLDGLGGAAGVQQVALAVYADLDGEPGALLARSVAATVEAGRAEGWLELPLTAPLELGAGMYHLAVLGGATGGVARYSRAPALGRLRYGPQDFADAGATSFGLAKPDNYEVAIHALVADVEPPSPPAEFGQASATPTAVTVSWAPAQDDVGVAGYALYRGSELVATTTSLSYTHEALECGTTYTLGVDAFDAAGNRSATATVMGQTTPCDTTAPTSPIPTIAGSSATTIALIWSPSQDEVGVAGYNVYRDGTKVAATALTAHVVTGLECGATYAVAVDAYDAAGNVSPPATVSASTAPCPEVREPTCDKVAAPDGSDAAAGTAEAPYLTPQKLADELAPDQTGCLRSGTYSAEDTYVLELATAGIRIRSFPSERATLMGSVHVRSSAAGAAISHVDIEGLGGSNTVKIYAPDVLVEEADITNAWRGASCMILGSNSGYGQAARVVVRRNVFHECGDPAQDNKDHAIYAQNVLDGEIVGNVFWNSAAYAIQLYPNAQRTRVANNVVDGDAPSVRGGVLFGGSGTYASSDNVVEHNVIAYAATYNITSSWSDSAPGTGNIARQNCLWGGARADVNTAKGGFTAVDNLVADPLFVDRGARDYRLGVASLCRLLPFDPDPGS